MPKGKCKGGDFLQVRDCLLIHTRSLNADICRKAAASLHPGAMYRLGTAELNGNLGLNRRPKEGVKWLKRSAEHATEEFPHALHELALLHARGIENVVFVDYEYAAELLAKGADLGYAPSAFKLGDWYEYGRYGLPQDPALSIHYYVRLLPQHTTPSTHPRTSLRKQVTTKRHSLWQHGILSAHPASFPNPTPKPTSGRRRQRRWASAKQCTLSDTLPKRVSAQKPT